MSAAQGEQLRRPPRHESLLVRAARVIAGTLMAAAVAPTAALLAHGLQSKPTMLTDSMSATEQHGEPRHSVAGLVQQAQLSAGSSSASTVLYSEMTIDKATPMAEVFLINDSLKALAHHQWIAVSPALQLARLKLPQQLQLPTRSA